MNYFSKVKQLITENDWILKFLSGQGYCIICNHDGVLDLEYHHVSGKYNDALIVSVCRNCHGRLSRKQRYWPKEWMQKNNPPELKEAFLALGLSDIFRFYSDSVFLKHEYM